MPLFILWYSKLFNPRMRRDLAISFIFLEGLTKAEVSTSSPNSYNNCRYISSGIWNVPAPFVYPTNILKLFPL